MLQKSMNPPNLNTICEDALEKILDYVDFEEILSLRKVCKSLRNIIIIKKPDIKLLGIAISVYPDSVSLQIKKNQDISKIDYSKKR